MINRVEVIGRFHAAEADDMNTGGAAAGADFTAMAATLRHCRQRPPPGPSPTFGASSARAWTPSRQPSAQTTSQPQGMNGREAS